MAMEKITEQPLALPQSPRLSASATSSPATVGALLNNAVATGAAPRECRSPRSLLSRFLGRGSGGFGCRMRLPRYCSTRAGAVAKEDVGDEVAAPNLVASNPAESPRSSLQGKKAAEPEVSAASLGLGAGLVLLLSKGAAELSRMAELRAQMERLVMDARAAEARGGGGRSVDDGASVVKERIVFADAEDKDASSSHGSRSAAASAGENAASAMDQMEAELEAELTRLQLSSDYESDECATPKPDHQLESEAKSDVSSERGSPARVGQDGVADYAAGECKEDDGADVEEEEEESTPCHFGVPAQVLERRLHELLQSRHEERIAELETELERAQKKLLEKEREVSRWRDTAKLASRHKDESRLR